MLIMENEFLDMEQRFTLNSLRSVFKALPNRNETIIDDTLKKIDEKETDKNTTPTAPATPDTPKQ